MFVKNDRSFYSRVMPKVSEAHRAARREQILDAAMSRFAVNGFQATGMADVIATAGLSAGAVYRYFKSKDDLIEAIADRVLGQVAARFDEVLAEEPDLDPAGAVRVAVETLEEIAESGPVDVSRVAVQAWAEALRSERIAAVASGAYRTIRGYFIVVCRRAQDSGSLSAEADPEVLGAALYSLAAGFVLQRNLLGDVSAATYAPAVRALLEGTGKDA